MKYDFWNNPIVVSAIRVKFRRENPLRTATLYLMLLTIGGALAHYYSRVLPIPWPRFFFLAMMVFQFFISAFIALATTGSSLTSEVTQRTLDFQRIAALSPRQILFGKLLGQPLLAYLLALSTLPLAVLCCQWGAITLPVLALLFIHLATTTLLAGAVGFLVRLEPGTAGKTGSRIGNRGSGMVGITMFFLFSIVPSFVAMGPVPALTNPVSAPVLGLATPIPLFVGIYEEKPFLYELNVFEIKVPFAYVSPWVQLFLAFLCFHTMERQLLNPLLPSLSRKLAYTALILFDVVFAGLVYNTFPLFRFVQRSAMFCLGHLVVCIVLTSLVTPWRESLVSWMWRYRRRVSMVKDSLLGNRSENLAVLWTFTLIGATIFVGGVIWPEIKSRNLDPDDKSMVIALEILATTLILLLSFGRIYQLMVFLAGRSGGGALLTLLMFLVAGPHILGATYDWEWLLDLTPSHFFGLWLAPKESNPEFVVLLPMLGVYLLLAVLASLSFRARMNRLGKTIDRKLGDMGVPLSTTDRAPLGVS